MAWIARGLIVAAVLLIVPPQARTALQPSADITSPLEQFGAAIGDDYFLVTYSELEAYWKRLASESNRMRLVDIGRTAEGRTQWMAVISSPENLERVERYKAISRRLALAENVGEQEARALAAEGRAIVWIDGGLHATEVLGSHQLIEMVYQLVSRSDPETLRILRDVIVLAVHANPDGHELVARWYMREPDPRRRTLEGLPRLYHKYVGHDNNRDFFLSSQPETTNMNRVLYHEWFPQVVLDHHQSAPLGTVMFIPPFRDPLNYVLDPLIPASLDLFGAAMQARFLAEGKAGVTTRRGATYSTWWNGGLRTTAYFHNQIGLLTETIGGPTPTEIPFVPERQLPSTDLPFPIPPQTWRFRQSIDYAMTANRAVLDTASRYRELLLFNSYRMAANAIRRGSSDTWTASPRLLAGLRTETAASGPRPRATFEAALRDPRQRDPRGYILPSDQPDFLTATRFVGALIKAGVRVHRATRAFTANGRAYPAGSYVVKTAQAFRPHILDMFEPQNHPDDIPYPGGPPVPPYDIAGWTLAFQMGVRFDRMLDAFDGPFEPVTMAAPPPGRVTGGTDVAGYLVGHHQNDAFIAVNRLLAAGADVYWPQDRSGGPEGTGAMYIASGPAVRPILEQAAAELGLVFTGTHTRPPSAALKLQPVRIALWDREGGSTASGWTRWILEQYEFPHEVVRTESLIAPDLLSRFDVIVLPDDAGEGRERELTLDRAARALGAFVMGGGTLLAIGDATAIAERLGVPVSNALSETARDGTRRGLPRSRFYIPGSILRIRVDNRTPLGYGFPEEVDVMFDNSPAFRVAPGARQPVRRVAWFDRPSPLRSGWAWGQHLLEGTAAVVDAAVGRGRVLLFGPEIAFRGQSYGTFKFLFNGIFYSTALGSR